MAKIFISYSHRDRAWLERLQVHLKPLERDGLLDRWDDSRIQAGDLWREEIRKGLKTSNAAVLLVSADFLASDFISNEELPALLSAEKARGLKIFLVVLKPCRIAGTTLAELQTIHPIDQPMIQMSEAEQEAVWVKLAEELERCLTTEKKVTQNPENLWGKTPEQLWNVPYERNPFFSGREKVLEQLRKNLLANSKAAFTGLGGIGKTQVAVEYTYRHRDDYTQVFWTRATSEPDLISGFVEIGRLINLPESFEPDQKEAVYATQRWLESNSGWLLVFDNVCHPELIKAFRPKNQKGHILITSRNPAVQNMGIITPLNIERLSKEEAIEFLLKRTARTPGNPREDKAIADLAKELGYLPLALEQAAAYIFANQARFSDYIKSYRSRRLAVLTAPVAGEYPDSVTTTWALNFREVAHAPQAADLLRLSAFFFPDAIPLELIVHGAPELGPSLSAALADVLQDPLTLDEALEPLYRYSLVRRDVSARTYSIHPIVQAVLLDSMPVEEQQTWAERAVRAVNKAFPEPEYAHWPACERLLPQAQVCADLISKWNFEFPEAGTLLQDAGTYLRKRARLLEAIKMQQQLLAFQEKKIGADHPKITEIIVNLAKLFRHQGRYAEAESLLHRALTTAENSINLEDIKVSEILVPFSALYHNMGKIPEAEKLARRALEIQEKILGSEHPDLAKCLTNLAGILISRQEFHEAQNLIERSLALEEKKLGPMHHQLAINLTMLAETYRLQNQLSDCEPILQRALHLDETAFGPDHPSVAWSILGLAELYINQDRYEEAITLYNRALRIREKSFSLEHPLVIETRQRYTALLTQLGRDKEASDLIGSGM